LAARILVVDDEPGVRQALEAILADEGFRVSSAGSGEQGLEMLEQERFDAVLLDVWLPGMDGLETLQAVRERHAETEVVMISGHGTIETAVRATKLGAFDFVEKPLSLEKTLLVLRNALRQRKLEQVNRRLLAQLARDTEILGRSAAAQRLRRAVELATTSSAPVLIVGRPGSGREAVARRIHGTGPLAAEAFVEVPCGALDAVAADAALHGGAGRAGRVELASSGTLFLEDVDRLAPQVQQRLAAALAARAREPGAPRVLASARSDASDVVPELRGLLDVIRIRVPALRERREDVAWLAERLMRDLSREYGREPKRLAPDCLAALEAYDWPGDVRELRNVIERLLLFAPGEVVQPGDLPEGPGRSDRDSADLYGSFPSLVEGVRAFRRYQIRRALDEERADEAAAARRLGLTPAELRAEFES
jgi:two-component system nitrogen regulation response regulator NtrX